MVAHFFVQREAGSLAQQRTTLDWKEAFNSSPGPLPWTSYLTLQAPFLQLCKMGEKMSRTLNQCRVNEIQNKFLASSKTYGFGVQKKGSTGRAEQRITNIKETGKALE